MIPVPLLLKASGDPSYNLLAEFEFIELDLCFLCINLNWSVNNHALC